MKVIREVRPRFHVQEEVVDDRFWQLSLRWEFVRAFSTEDAANEWIDSRRDVGYRALRIVETEAEEEAA